jgi:hypothetical protein
MSLPSVTSVCGSKTPNGPCRNKVKSGRCHHHQIPKTECGVCMDLCLPMKCGHAVCELCLQHLRQPTCPECRSFIEGPLITDEILANIINRQMRDENETITSDYMMAMSNATSDETIDLISSYIGDETMERLYYVFIYESPPAPA